MGGLSIWHWLIVAIILATFFIPVVLILKRLGFSGWWVLLNVVPLGFVIGIWILALKRWPIADATEAHLGFSVVKR